MNSKNYAGFGIRLLASLVDSLLLLAPHLIFWWWLGLSGLGLKEFFVLLLWYLLIFFVYGFLVITFYSSLLTAFWGGTIGKLLAGLRVENEKGTNLSLGKSLFRHLIGYQVSALLFFLGYFWIIKDEKKQGWHDQLAGTYVVRKKKKMPWTVVLSFILLLVVNLGLIMGAVRGFKDSSRLQKDLQELKELFQTETFDSETEEEWLEEETIQDWSSLEEFESLESEEDWENFLETIGQDWQAGGL